jgi:hypothetical protein
MAARHRQPGRGLLAAVLLLLSGPSEGQFAAPNPAVAMQSLPAVNLPRNTGGLEAKRRAQAEANPSGQGGSINDQSLAGQGSSQDGVSAYTAFQGQGFDRMQVHQAQSVADTIFNISDMATIQATWAKRTARAKSFKVRCIGFDEAKFKKLLDPTSARGHQQRMWCCRKSMGCANPNFTMQQEPCENAVLSGGNYDAKPDGYPGQCRYNQSGERPAGVRRKQTCVYNDKGDQETSTVSNLSPAQYFANFDCANLCEGTDDQAKGWSKYKIKACCRQEQKFCKLLIPKSAKKSWTNVDKYTSKPLDSIQFNCSHGLNRPRAWNPIKRRWCYEHWSIGTLPAESTWTTKTTTTVTTTSATTITTTSTTAGKHDCYYGVKDWVNTFSYPKKEYCCKYWDRKENWPVTTRPQCCDYLGIGCLGPLPTTTSPPYDCSAGYFNWIKGWSPNKKVYCCREKGRGCIFDCSADYHHGDWRQEWSMAKKAWCCLTERRGCPAEEQEDAQEVRMV